MLPNWKPRLFWRNPQQIIHQPWGVTPHEWNYAGIVYFSSLFYPHDVEAFRADPLTPCLVVQTLLQPQPMTGLRLQRSQAQPSLSKRIDNCPLVPGPDGLTGR